MYIYDICRNIDKKHIKPHFHLIFPNKTTSVAVIYDLLFQPYYLIISY